MWPNPEEISKKFQKEFSGRNFKVLKRDVAFAEAAVSSRFFKIGVLKNFAIFTEKYLCYCLFLTILQASRPTVFLKRDFNTGFFLWMLQNCFEQLLLQNTLGGCFCIWSKPYTISLIWLNCLYQAGSLLTFTIHF